MNLVFLDYDGVVNTTIFFKNEDNPRACQPKDNMVSNYQACRWLSRLCLETNSKIVVTSSWRYEPNYKECLYNGGLDTNVEIIGKTGEFNYQTRGYAINNFLEHFEVPVEHMVILDDRNDMDMYYDYLVECDSTVGFTRTDYFKAKFVLEKDIKYKT